MNSADVSFGSSPFLDFLVVVVVASVVAARRHHHHRDRRCGGGCGGQWSRPVAGFAFSVIIQISIFP